MVSAVQPLEVQFGVLQLCSQFLALLLQLLHRALRIFIIGLRVSQLQKPQSHTLFTADCVTHFYNSMISKVSCPSLQMPFALLLSLKLVLKLLLEFLFAKVHFTNGSVVFYPPLTSWKKKA